MLEDPKSSSQHKPSISQRSKGAASTPVKTTPQSKVKKVKAIAPIAGQRSLDFFIKREGKKQVSVISDPEPKIVTSKA